MLPLIVMVLISMNMVGVVGRGRCYRIGGRYVEGYEIFLSFILLDIR